MLEKFRAASEDPEVAKRLAERAAVNEARRVRAAEREVAERVRQAELAEQARREAERAAQAQREAEAAEALAAAERAEREAALEAEQKAARDARYAARKAAKKVRRRGLTDPAGPISCERRGPSATPTLLVFPRRAKRPWIRSRHSSGASRPTTAVRCAPCAAAHDCMPHLRTVAASILRKIRFSTIRPIRITVNRPANTAGMSSMFLFS